MCACCLPSTRFLSTACYIWQAVSVGSPPWRERRASPRGIWTALSICRHCSSFPPRTAETHQHVDTGVQTRPHEKAGRQDADQGQDADRYCAPPLLRLATRSGLQMPVGGGLDAGRPVHARRACADAFRILWPLVLGLRKKQAKRRVNKKARLE